MDVYIGTIFPWPISYAPDGFQLCCGQSLTINQYEAVYSLIGTRFGADGSANFRLPDFRGRVPLGAGGAQSYQIGQSVGVMANTFGISSSNLPAHIHGASFTPVMTPMNVTIPATAPQGSISASVTAKVNAGIGGTASPAANANVYLGGLSAKAGAFTATFTGPYDSAQSASTANLQGVTVAVTPSSGYTPGTQAATVAISAVTGGSVAIQAGGGTLTPSPIILNNLQPSLAMNFIFCVTGIYPVNPN